jgi:hypothetical protein
MSRKVVSLFVSVVLAFLAVLTGAVAANATVITIPVGQDPGGVAVNEGP